MRLCQQLRRKNNDADGNIYNERYTKGSRSRKQDYLTLNNSFYNKESRFRDESLKLSRQPRLSAERR